VTVTNLSRPPRAEALLISESNDELAIAQPSIRAIAAPPGTSWWRRTTRAAVGPLVVLAILIGIWYFITYVILDPTRRFLMPAPQTVINTAFLNHADLILLLKGLAVTTEAAMVGLAISIAVGVSVAIVMSEAKVLERGLFPYLVVLQTIPILALVPLIGFWIGYGFTARVMVCILISLFPIMANTLFGLQSYPSTYNELFSLHQVGRWKRLIKLKLPMALPAMFAGFRIAAGLSVIGEIVGGFFFQRGQLDLGALLDEFTARLNGPMLFGTVILASALGVAIFGIFSAISAVVVGRWKE
jgi:NitT/TauT family transport system permease protein